MLISYPTDQLLVQRQLLVDHTCYQNDFYVLRRYASVAAISLGDHSSMLADFPAVACPMHDSKHFDHYFK